MSSLFKSILIPVDFSANTEAAINQAIELACINGSTIHLLHIMKPKAIWGVIPVNNRSVTKLNENYYAEKIVSRLLEWRLAIEQTISYCKVNTYVAEGIIYAKIQDAAKEIKPELIIISKNSNHRLFSLFNSVCPNGLAKATGYPVLTVMKKTVDTKIKIIVVPVGSFIPSRKIELVIELAKKHRAAIHLVTIPNKIDFEETKGNSFLETYRILKNVLTSPIEHHILKGNNLPKAILEYAQCIGADLILANPGSETRISNFTGKHINDTLTISSKLKVLSIEPYHDHALSVGNGLEYGKKTIGSE
jgi:nucleotide-binding universal stress UspA family protein